MVRGPEWTDGLARAATAVPAAHHGALSPRRAGPRHGFRIRAKPDRRRVRRRSTPNRPEVRSRGAGPPHHPVGDEDLPHRGAPARHELRLQLSEGAYVEHIPDTLIPQAGADYRADHARRAGARGGADHRRRRSPPVVSDVASGSRIAGLVLETFACRDGEELFAERLRLEPARVRPDAPGMLGGWDYLVSVTVLAPEQDGAALADAIDAELATRSDVRGGAGAVTAGSGSLRPRTGAGRGERR